MVRKRQIEVFHLYFQQSRVDNTSPLIISINHLIFDRLLVGRHPVLLFPVGHPLGDALYQELENLIHKKTKSKRNSEMNEL